MECLIVRCGYPVPWYHVLVDVQQLIFTPDINWFRFVLVVITTEGTNEEKTFHILQSNYEKHSMIRIKLHGHVLPISCFHSCFRLLASQSHGNPLKDKSNNCRKMKLYFHLVRGCYFPKGHDRFRSARICRVCVLSTDTDRSSEGWNMTHSTRAV